MNCINEHKEEDDFQFRVLQVETFHVRDMGKESKVQALGDFTQCAVSPEDARAALQKHLNIRPRVLRTVLPLSLLTAAGLILAVCFWHGEGALRLAGLGMAGCGILCMWGLLRDLLRSYRILSSMPEDQALSQCAWECALARLPRKHGDNDLSYIPVNEETMGRKNGDLMILYDLLPQIAVQAYNRIHGLEEPEA